MVCGDGTLGMWFPLCHLYRWNSWHLLQFSGILLSFKACSCGKGFQRFIWTYWFHFQGTRLHGIKTLWRKTKIYGSPYKYDIFEINICFHMCSWTFSKHLHINYPLLFVVLLLFLPMPFKRPPHSVCVLITAAVVSFEKMRTKWRRVQFNSLWHGLPW